MLRFFRKIRQKYLSENKFSKYFTYAMGEVFLVMIGILLALQVNNWNEGRQTNSLEQNYLALLKEEFNYNLESLEKVMGQNKRYADRAFAISKLTGPSTPQISEEKFDSLLFGTIFTEVQYRPRNGVLNEIINSGKLNIFTNQSLRVSLSSWDGALYKVKFQEQEMNKLRIEIFDLINEEGNSRRLVTNAQGAIFGLTQSKFENGSLELLNSVEFENLLIGFIATYRYANKNYYPNLKVEIEKILTLIDTQINME